MIIYNGIDLLGRLLAGQAIEINCMYLEFKNGGLPYPVVTPDPSEGRSYYAALDTGLSDRDYIRVPLTADPTVESSDVTKFLTNRVQFIALSAGYSAGRGGHPFTAAAQSVIYGVALVAAPDLDDASQDIVFSRSYAPSDFTAKVKLVNEEISIVWPHTFGDAMLSSS